MKKMLLVLGLVLIGLCQGQIDSLQKNLNFYYPEEVLVNEVFEIKGIISDGPKAAVYGEVLIYIEEKFNNENGSPMMRRNFHQEFFFTKQEKFHAQSVQFVLPYIAMTKGEIKVLIQVIENHSIIYEKTSTIRVIPVIHKARLISPIQVETGRVAKYQVVLEPGEDTSAQILFFHENGWKEVVDLPEMKKGTSLACYFFSKKEEKPSCPMAIKVIWLNGQINRFE